MSKNPNTLIITGACGFIGRHLLERLQDYPGPVLAVDRIEPKGRFPESIRFHRSDLMDPSQLIPSDLDISDGFVLIHHETAAPVIEKPLYFNVILKYPIGYAVCFQMVFLIVVHVDQNLCRVGACAQNEQAESQKNAAKKDRLKKGPRRFLC